MNVFEKLNKIQTELKAPKNNEVKDKFGKLLYKYRSAEDILESVKILLKEYKAVITITDDIVILNSKLYLKSTAIFIDTETGEKITAVGLACEPEKRGILDASQITGGTSSYAKKYALNNLLAIDDTKDPDFYDNSEQSQQKGQSSKKTEPKQKAQPQQKEDEKQLVNDKQVAEIMFGCGKHNIDVGVILQKYKIDSLKNLTISQYKTLTNRFKELDKEIKEKGDIKNE